MGADMKKLIIDVILGVLGALLFLFLVFGCSGDFHARKALKRGVNIVKTDTVVRIDTVWRVVQKVDTVFKYKFDTVTYYQDSVLVKYFYNVKDSLVYIEIDCPDCPEVTREIIIDNTVLVKERTGFFYKLWVLVKGNLLILIAVLVGVGVWAIYKTFLKR